MRSEDVQKRNAYPLRFPGTTVFSSPQRKQGVRPGTCSRFGLRKAMRRRYGNARGPASIVFNRFARVVRWKMHRYQILHQTGSPMASRNGRSKAKTNTHRPSRAASSHERRSRKQTGQGGHKEGHTNQEGKLADKSALGDKLLTPRIGAKRLQAEAHQAFLLELPNLLQNHSGQWVVYRGKTQLGLSAGKTALLQKCLRGGLDAKELMVRRIHPGADEPPTLFEPGPVRDR
jgi:hypothetical protein